MFQTLHQTKTWCSTLCRLFTRAVRGMLASNKGWFIQPSSSCRHFNIPRQTILNKLKQKHTKQVGKPTIFSRDEEESFVSYIETLSDFGFPITTEDLRYVVRSYLERTSRAIKDFQGNKPGLEWMKHFLKRCPRLKERMASNINRSRAAVTEDILQDYIKNLQEVVKDMTLENIWNLDETKLSDDPLKKKVICRRGTKYPERLCIFSKSSTSFMICGSAADEILPPFVVYKGTQMWDVWTQGGPKNTRYLSTKSGWFDGPAFTLNSKCIGMDCGRFELKKVCPLKFGPQRRGEVNFVTYCHTVHCITESSGHCPQSRSRLSDDEHICFIPP